MASGSSHSGNECGISFILILYTRVVYLSLNDLNLKKITMLYTNGIGDDNKSRLLLTVTTVVSEALFIHGRWF